MLTLILQLTVVILFSALFSGMEIAFVSSNRLLLGIDQSNRSLTSFVIDKYYSNSNNFISSLLVGNNISIVIYSMLMAQFLGIDFQANVPEWEYDKKAYEQHLKDEAEREKAERKERQEMRKKKLLYKKSL